MKKLSFALMGMVLALTSCQNDMFEPAMVPDGEGNVCFTVSVPEQFATTRTANLGPNSSSALGGITNVDWTKYDLRYQLAVYEVGDDGNGDKTYTEVVAPVTKVVNTYSGVSYAMQLPPNKTYHVVVWADFVDEGTTSDKHYDTSDFTDIRCLSTGPTHLNDESRDAYFIQKTFTVDNTNANQNLVLKRPFGKLRIVTTDWNRGSLEMADTYRLTYYGCKRFRGVNAVTGRSTHEETLAAKDASTEVYTTTIDKTNLDYELNIDRDTYCRTVVVDYLMADYDIIGSEPVHFSIDAINSEDNNKLIATHDFSTDIPVRRNWLTTIMGDLHTVGALFNIECSELFDGEYADYYHYGDEIDPIEPTYEEATNTYLVSDAAQLAWFTVPANMTYIGNRKTTSPTIKLTADIDLQGAEWTPMVYFNPEKPLVFDGNGKFIRNLRIMTKGTQRGLFGSLVGNIKNLTLSNVVIAQASLHSGGLVGNLYGNVENVTILDEYLVGDGSLGYGDGNFQYDAILPNIWNLGGMIGIHNQGNLTDCHVKDLNVESGWSAGGLVAAVNETSNRVYTNCSVDEATLWIRWRSLSPHMPPRPVDGTSDDAPDQLLSVGAIIAHVYDGYKVTLTGCSSSDITYRIGNFNDDYQLMSPTQSIFFLQSGEEGEHTFVDRYGMTVHYGPVNSLVGYYEANSEVVIDGTSYLGTRNNPQWLQDLWVECEQTVPNPDGGASPKPTKQPKHKSMLGKKK